MRRNFIHTIFLGVLLTSFCWAAHSQLGPNFRRGSSGAIEIRILGGAGREKWVSFDPRQARFIETPSIPREHDLRRELRDFVAPNFRRTEAGGIQIHILGGSNPGWKDFNSTARFLTSPQNDREIALNAEYEAFRKPNFRIVGNNVEIFALKTNQWEPLNLRRATFLASPSNPREIALQAEYLRLILSPPDPVSAVTAFGAAAAAAGAPPIAPCAAVGGMAPAPVVAPKPISPFADGLARLKTLSSQPKTTSKENWGFPSDHIPVGGIASVPGVTPFPVMSFNVLNENYTKGAGANNLTNQGLQNSFLGQLDGDRGQNPEVRHAAVFEVINRMIQGSTAPAPAVVSLQEVSPVLLKKLNAQLRGTDYQVVSTTQHTAGGGAPPRDHGVMLVDTRRFAVSREEEVSLTSSGSAAPKYIQQVSLIDKATQKSFEVWNTHVPFDGASNLTTKMNAEKNPLLVMGDFNMNKATAKATFPNASFLDDTNAEFSHQNTQKSRQTYDHVVGTHGASIRPDSTYTKALVSYFGTNNENKF